MSLERGFGDDMGLLTNLSLFSGAGGLDLGAKLSGGFKTICYVEWNRYAQAVLRSRISEGELDDAPIWDDITTFDGKPWFGLVDVVSGGFPCQDLSLAGKRKGIVYGSRSGLWKEFARTIREVGPQFVIVENVPGLLMGGGISIVLGDLASMGFHAEWGTWGACAIGAPHSRERVFIVAHSARFGWRGMEEEQKKFRRSVHGEGTSPWRDKPSHLLHDVERIIADPREGVLRVDDGLEKELDPIKLCGNGVVPQQSIPIWEKIKRMNRQ